MKAAKKIPIYLTVIIFIAFLLIVFLVVNYSRGYITQHTSLLDTKLHESTLNSFVDEGLVIVDFDMVAESGQSPFSFSLLPGTWKMKIKAMYEDKLLEQEIRSCVDWGKGSVLPGISVECNRKLYSAELGDKQLIVYEDLYDFDTHEVSNKLKFVTIPLPKSIKHIERATGVDLYNK